MANTWTALAQGVAFAATKNMLGVLNGGARVLRIRRIWLLNVQTAAVTGVLCGGSVRRYSGAGIGLSGSTPVTPVAHDSGNSALSSVTIGTAGTPAGATVETLRNYAWSSDEAAVSGATVDELEMLPAYGLIWDAGYADGNVQPLVIRPNEMLCIYNVSGAAGLVDVAVEFTDEAA